MVRYKKGYMTCLVEKALIVGFGIFTLLIFLTILIPLIEEIPSFQFTLLFDASSLVFSP
ncbi:MAG: hypothetical protein ACFFAO_01495 [Candidatus Hermodarchaeota archaeon]